MIQIISQRIAFYIAISLHTVVKEPTCNKADKNLLMVGLTGFEPVTSPLSGARSNQLSYRPDRSKRVVEQRRLELLTSCLQSRRSTN